MQCVPRVCFGESRASRQESPTVNALVVVVAAHPPTTTLTRTTWTSRRDVMWRDAWRDVTRRDVTGDTPTRVSGRDVHEPRKSRRRMACATRIRWSCLLVTVRRLAPIRARPRWRHRRFDTCRRTTRQLDFTTARRRPVYYEQRILRTLHTLRLSGRILIIIVRVLIILIRFSSPRECIAFYTVTFLSGIAQSLVLKGSTFSTALLKLKNDKVVLTK